VVFLNFKHCRPVFSKILPVHQFVEHLLLCNLFDSMNFMFHLCLVYLKETYDKIPGPTKIPMLVQSMSNNNIAIEVLFLVN
jgi:hypothetical protein